MYIINGTTVSEGKDVRIGRTIKKNERLEK